MGGYHIGVYIYIYVCVYIYTYIYIYMYVYIYVGNASTGFCNILGIGVLRLLALRPI